MINLEDLMGKDHSLTDEQRESLSRQPDRADLAHEDFIQMRFEMFVDFMFKKTGVKLSRLAMESLYTGYYLGVSEMIFGVMAHMKHHPGETRLRRWLDKRVREVFLQENSVPEVEFFDPPEK